MRKNPGSWLTLDCMGNEVERTGKRMCGASAADGRRFVMGRGADRSGPRGRTLRR